MLFEIGQYKLDIDIAKTKRFYDSADRVSQYCTCDGCLNFEKAVDFLSPAVRTLFAELGVDMKTARTRTALCCMAVFTIFAALYWTEKADG